MMSCWTALVPLTDRRRRGAVAWNFEEGLVPLALVRSVVEMHGSGSSSFAYWSTAVSIRGVQLGTTPHLTLALTL